jgi:hypothetical protein
VFNTVVRYNVKLKEAASMGSPITEFLPGSRGHRDYRSLAQELVSADLEALADVDTLVEEDIDLREEEIDRRIENVYGAVAVRGGVKFVCHAPGAHEVSVAGDFNEWSPDSGNMVPTEVDNVWEKQIEMPDGRHEYRLVIDGRWTSDPANPYVSSNPFGELNSVVGVK